MPDEELTQKAFADRIGRTPRVVRKHTKAGVLTRLPNGKYPWPEAHEQWLAHLKTERERRYAKKEKPILDEERARKMAADADRAEMARDKDRGLYVTVDDMDRELRKLIGVVDAGLRNASSRYASELAQAAGIDLAVAAELLQAIFENVRGDLRRAGEELPDDDGD